MMGFFDSNFWEKPKSFLDQMFRPINFTPPNVTNPLQQGQTPWSKPFDPIQATKDMSAYIPGTSIPKPPNYGSTASAEYSPGGPANSGSSALADRQIRDRLEPKLWDALGKIGDSAFGAVDEVVANDPMTIYEQIRNATPGYTYKGPSAEAMAKAQFDPVFKMLLSQRNQGTARYGEQKAAAADSYGDYVGDLRQSQNDNQQTYARAGSEIDAAGKTASNQVSGETQESAAALAKILKGLGQQHTAGQLLSENQGELTKQLGTVASNQTAAKNLNTGLAAATKTRDEDTVNLGKQAGLNYQGDIYRDYDNMLRANDQQNLQLQGQKGQAQNEYTMSIEELLSKAAGSREEAISKQFAEFMDQNFRRDQMNNQTKMDQARLNLDATKAGIGPDGQPIKGGALDPTKPSPADAYKVLQSAAAGSGLPQQQQVVAVDAIMQAIANAPEAKSVGELMANVETDVLRSPNVRDLAYTFFSQYLGKV